MLLIIRALMCAALFAAYSSHSVAQEWLTNMEGGFAECDIKIDGKPFLTGACNFHFFYGDDDETRMFIDSADYYIDSDIISPNKEIILLVSNKEKMEVGFVMYHQKGMSKYGDAYTSPNPARFENGCLKAGRIDACLKYLNGGNSNISEQVFRQVPKKARKKLQEFLKDRGYYDDKIDGAWGEKTAKALLKYDQINSLLEGIYRGKHSHYNLYLFSQNIQLYNHAEVAPSYSEATQYNSSMQTDNGYFGVSDFCFNPNDIRAKINDFEDDARTELKARHMEIHNKWCTELGAEKIDLDILFWSASNKQCDINNYPSDDTPPAIKADSKDYTKWQKFEIQYYEGYCSAEVKYIDPKGNFISGIANCMADVDVPIRLGIRIASEGEGKLSVNFSGQDEQYKDFIAYDCNY
jgi:hypothetical protein